MRKTMDGALTYRWLIFLVIGVQYLVVYFHRVAPAVVATELMETFSISGTSLGILASAYLYSYGIMQIPVGVLSDSWGPRKTIAVSTLITAVGGILFGLSPDFGTAVVARILVGLGVSAIFVAGMRLLATWFRPVEYGRISSVFMTLGGVGWFLATTPLVAFASLFGWRLSFVSVGILCFVLSVLTWVLVADRPEARGYRRIVEEGTPSAGGRAKVIGDLRRILSEAHFWAVAVWFVCRGGALFGFFGLWAGPYLADVYRLPKGTIGNILSMIAVAMIFFSPIMGHISDRTLGSRKKVLVGTSVLNTLSFVVMVLFYDTLPVPGLYLLFLVMGITISSVGTLAITTTKEFFPLEIAGTAMGTINLFPFIGGIIFQPLMGRVLDHAGKAGGAYPSSAYRTIAWIYLATSLVALISILFCRETLTKEKTISMR